MAVWVVKVVVWVVLVLVQVKFFYKERVLMTTEAKDDPMAAAAFPVVKLACPLSCLQSEHQLQKKQAQLNQAYLLNDGVNSYFLLMALH